MYTNETTHYSIPKPLGTDLTVPMDYNDAADVIDDALFNAFTNATEAVTAAANAVDAAADAVEEVGNLGTTVNNLVGRTSALETSDVIQNNKIDALENQGDTKFDSVGIADAYVNGLTYSVGDIVTYNGQRYKCITAVTASEPFDADKWSAEDIETVITELKSDLANCEFTVLASVTANGVKTEVQILNELYQIVKNLDTNVLSKSRLIVGNTIVHCASITTNAITYTSAGIHSGNDSVLISRFILSSASVADQFTSGYSDISSVVPSSGQVWSIVIN